MDFTSTATWLDHAVAFTIKHEHDALRDKLRRIHNVIESTKPSAKEVEDLLRDYYRLLEFRFLAEETDAFFHEISEKALHLLAEAKRLCEGHRQLLSDAAELCRFANAGSPSVPWWRELRTRCHEFTQRLRLHEEKEKELLQEARQTYLAGGD